MMQKKVIFAVAIFIIYEKDSCFAVFVDSIYGHFSGKYQNIL